MLSSEGTGEKPGYSVFKTPSQDGGNDSPQNQQNNPTLTADKVLPPQIYIQPVLPLEEEAQPEPHLELSQGTGDFEFKSSSQQMTLSHSSAAGPTGKKKKFAKKQPRSSSTHKAAKRLQPPALADGSTTPRRTQSPPNPDDAELINYTLDVKHKMLKLFLSYADFIEKSAVVFISHARFLKLVEDAEVNIHQNDLSIMISTTLQTKSSCVKAIYFDQFLDLLNALSELLSPKLFREDPKKALNKLIQKFLLVLLAKLEHPEGQRWFGPAAIYSYAQLQQEMMTFTSDIYAVMAQLNNVLRQIYTHYFKAELSALQRASRHTLAELRHESLDCCLQFLKDFGLCPYVVNRKLSFYVWHSVQMSIGRSDATELLTNDPHNTLIVPGNTGKAFTLA